MKDLDYGTCCECGEECLLALCWACSPTHQHSWRPGKWRFAEGFWECRCGVTDKVTDVYKMARNGVEIRQRRLEHSA